MMGRKAPKKVKNMSKTAIKRRVKIMVDMRENVRKNLEDYHVRLMEGNSKTGKNCYTVSLIPIADCPNCSGCAFGGCYDIQNVCFQPCVQIQRAINSAIHKWDRERYWKEIGKQIDELHVHELRLNVGGDLEDEDFILIQELAKEHSDCHILFFTKNYKGINKFFDENGQFESNVHPVMSIWEGMEYANPYNIPEAHILWVDGRTTAPTFGAKYCGGNCSECFFHNMIGNEMESGCWGLKSGEHVIFPAH